MGFLWVLLRKMVGARGFEPPTPRSRTELSPANNGDDAQPVSRRDWLEPVLVVKAAENRRGNDAATVGNSMTIQHRSGCEAVGNAWSKTQTRVRTPAIVMRDPRLEDASGMALVQWNHPVEALAAYRANQALAECV